MIGEPDIPKLYTAFSEWASCFIFILLLPQKKLFRTVIIIVSALPAFCFLQYYIGILQIQYWLMGMVLSLIMIYVCLILCCRISYADAGFFWATAFILAEFTASIEWQLYSFFMKRNIIFQQVQIKNICMVFFYTIVYLSVYFIEKKYISLEKRTSYSSKETFSAIILSIAVFLISNISYVYINTPFSSTNLSGIFYIRTLVDFSGLLMLISLQERCRQNQIEKELHAVNTILFRQYELYNQSKENIDAINRKYHDLKHQITIIRAEDNTEKRNLYLKDIETNLKMYESRYKTGNAVLDTILTSKNMYCAQHDINFTCMADGTLLNFMDTMDICTIFGNSLDNAIESAEQLIDRDKRIIKAAVYAQNNFLMITFENYYETPIKLDETGKPATTKQDKEYHGYGLKSIRYTVEKYNGSFTIHTENNWFILRILISLSN
ncbi:MAG TPA: ATP-binding protein [Treponema sp.]|nr:ATP-binding protein [Treponema sp.]